jgi:succinoglycan biosynthesis protein ExoO
MTKPASTVSIMAALPPGQDDLVSVVMSNFRGARWLPDAIASVLAQTHQSLELIIVDDASGDDSVAIIQGTMATDPRIRLVECPQNIGPAGARNLGLDAARGAWVAIVDSDDLIHPARLERLVGAARRLGCDAVADDMIFFGDTPAVGGRTLMQSLALTAPKQLLLEEFIASDNGGSGLPPYGYLKPLIRREPMGNLRYDPTLRVGEDFDFYARLIAQDLCFMLVPDAMYLYRRHSASLSHRLTTEALVPLTVAHAALEQSVSHSNPKLVAALRHRRDALTWALHYSQLVTALKRGNVSAIFRLLSRHPRLMKPLWQSMRERLARRQDGGLPAQKSPLTLVLMPADADLPPEISGLAAPDARRIPVPQLALPGEPTAVPLAPLAAELSRLSSQYQLDVLAIGPDGRHAAGMLPQTSGFRFWPEPKV